MDLGPECSSFLDLSILDVTESATPPPFTPAHTPQPRGRVRYSQYIPASMAC